MTLVTVKRKKSVKIPRTVLINATKAAATAAGHYFKRNMLPVRFTKRGATLLNYAPRKGERGSGRPFKGSYTQRKLRARGHTKPLVWTGDSEKASRTARVDVKRRNKTGGVLIVDGNLVFPSPNLNYKNPKSQAHPSEEIKRVAPSETKELARVAAPAFDKSLSRQLKQRK